MIPCFISNLLRSHSSKSNTNLTVHKLSLGAVGEHSVEDAYEKRLEMPKDAVIKQMKNSRLTALCLINTRALAGVQVLL